MLKIAVQVVPGLILLALLLPGFERLREDGPHGGTTYGERGMAAQPTDPMEELYSDKYKHEIGKEDLASAKPAEGEPAGNAEETSKGPAAPAEPPRAPLALELRCEQGQLAACNDIGLLYAERWDEPKSRDLAQEWFGKACVRGSRRGCSQVRALAERYASTDKAARSKLLYRACDVLGDPRACDDELQALIAELKTSPEADRKARDAFMYLTRLCMASFPEPDGLCDTRWLELTQFLQKPGKVTKTVAHQILAEMDKKKMSGHYFQPTKMRREWTKD